jgi:pimeloyl-ACP methyl ester carboxylesterase
MAIFVVAHGAWSAGWVWKKMHAPLRAAGHVLWTPTLTGLGERSHLAHPDIDLDTHVADLAAVLEWEDLNDVILVGHSYGGMVATAVADRAGGVGAPGGRIAQLVYLDAFVPADGESLLDLVPRAMREAMLERARLGGEAWRIPPNPMPPDTPEADRAWAEPRRVPQPAKTFSTPARLEGRAALPRSYIYCRRCMPGDPFRRFAEAARRASGWRAFEIDSSHNPHITAPAELAQLLAVIAAAPA